MKKIADWADLYYITFACHNMCTAIGTVGNAHLCAAIKSFVALESDRDRSAFERFFWDARERGDARLQASRIRQRNAADMGAPHPAAPVSLAPAKHSARSIIPPEAVQMNPSPTMTDGIVADIEKSSSWVGAPQPAQRDPAPARHH